MNNFKEIVEKCLAGELSGTFINRRGDIIPSDMLHKYDSIKYPYIYWENCITRNGNFFHNEEKISNYDIVDFIPANMQKKIEINIPEGKVPIVESSENGVIITWKEHELTYTELSDKFGNNINCIHSSLVNSASQAFYKKVEVLRKLTNIRNYFGKPDDTESGFYIYKFNENEFRVATTVTPAIYNINIVVFTTKEHAEQAIKMLGNELKYLFEPW